MRINAKRSRNRSLPSATLLTLLLAAVVWAEPPTEEGDLTVSEAARSIHGHFIQNEGATVAFNGERRQAGGAAVSIQANGLVFDVTYDPAAGKVTFDGHGGRVSPEGRRALEALSLVLEKRWKPYTETISVEKHFIFRMIGLLAEAPVGHVLDPWSIETQPLPPNVQP